MTTPPRKPSLLECAEDYEVLMLEPRELYDAAFMGVVRRAGEMCALYSEKKVLALMLADQPDADPDEVVEHYEVNTSGGLGWGMPMFMQDDDECGEEDEEADDELGGA